MSTVLTKEEEKTLQDEGAKAFAVNGLNARNPFYRPENQPTLTGEDVKIWQAKVKAWESGYETGRINKKS